MKEIANLNELQSELKKNSDAWVLLYKGGSVQSDNAVANFRNARADESVFLAEVNVAEVKDIHAHYGITSVPTLMYLEDGELKNIIKGVQTSDQYSAFIQKAGAVINKGESTEKNQPRVTVFTTPTCSWCTTIKRHFDANHIRYSEINVAADQKAAEEMVRKSGQQGVPQTEINGQMIVGFDKNRIDSLLGIQ